MKIKSRKSASRYFYDGWAGEVTKKPRHRAHKKVLYTRAWGLR